MKVEEKAGHAIRFGLACLCLLFSLAAGVARAEITAEASVSSTQVGTGEPFQLVVTVTTEEQIPDLPWPQIENLDNFSVTKNLSTAKGSQTMIINGRVSQRNQYIHTFSFTLSASKAGAFPLGPIRYASGSFSRNLGSTTITVVRQDPGLQLIPTLSKRQAYVGEQLTYTLRIIPNQGVQKITPPDFQKLIGEKFWFQHLDKNVEPKTVDIGGRPTRVFDVRIVLFPLLSGSERLPGIPIEYQQISRSQKRRPNSVFDLLDDDFFGGSVATLSAISGPVNLDVQPLPSGAPEDFSGSVGQYMLSASVDKQSLPSGEALTLTITVKGNGQPKSIVKPRLPDLASFEVFDPEITSTTNAQGSILLSSKTFKYVMVPRKPGNYEIEGIAYHYFDPRTRNYSIAESKPISVQVTQGTILESNSARIMSQKEITELGSDIRHIKSGSDTLRGEDDFAYKFFWFWVLFMISPLASLSLIFYRRYNLKLEGDATLKRRSQATGQVRKRVKEAKDALKQNSPRDFYRSLSQAVIGFASDKLNIEFRGLTMEESKGVLLRRGARTETLAAFEKLIHQCDFGQFSGAGRGQGEWESALKSAEEIIGKLDKELD